MKLKSIVTVGIATALLVSCAACGNGGESTAVSSKGQVYFLNYKPEVADQWNDLAQTYTKETGVTVKVETAASNTYEQTLKSEMAKTEAPTLFQVTGPVGLQSWSDYTADLSGTEIYKNLTLKDGELKSEDGKQVLAVPYAIETDGIIYNKDILAKYFKLPDAAVTSIKDLDSFDKLKAVADGIQKHKKELGVKGAFASSGFDPSSSWRFTDNLTSVPLYYEFKEDHIDTQPATIKGTYLPGYKKLFDLYLTDSTTDRTMVSGKTGDDANSEFALGEAAFYQNGNWAWTDLQNAGMTADQVGMIPEYMGIPGEETQGLSIGTGNFWCVSKKASKADQKATEDFLAWLVTSDTAKKSLSKDFGFTMPYKAYADVVPDNPLTATVALQEKEGKKPTNWNAGLMVPSTQWKNDFGNALLEYAQGTGDWDAVKTAFVDGWAKEYAAAHQS